MLDQGQESSKKSAEGVPQQDQLPKGQHSADQFGTFYTAAYGTQVAGEITLIETVLQACLTELNRPFDEGLLDLVCRTRQTKLSVHSQQTAEDSFEPLRLLNMLFEGCLRSLNGAVTAFEGQEGEVAEGHLVKAKNIITHLNGTLDHADGGSISKELARLYDFSLNQIEKASGERFVEHVQSVERVIDKIYRGYLELELRQDIRAIVAERSRELGEAH